MRVLILGGGVIGVTSAWYLRQAGHEVVVVDRQPAPALETSFANAGQLSFGYTSPWAAPGVPLKALKWLFTAHAPLSIRPGLDPNQYLWMLQLLRNCTTARYAINKSRMVRLAEYSRDCLDELRSETGIDYEGRQLGTVQLFRTQSQLDGAAKDIAVLQRYGVPYELLDREGIARVEPALAGVSGRLSGALRLPNDQTGDCELFTRRLRAMAEAAGVEFRFGQNLEGLEFDSQRITGVRVAGKVECADRYVLALGSYTPLLLRPLGIRLPVYPAKGYSATVPLSGDSVAPTVAMTDDGHKLVFSRLGNRLRVAGTAEFNGYNTELNQVRCQALMRRTHQLFPELRPAGEAEFWCGLRPSTPSNVPFIGRTKLSNLYLNTGHGTLGWTMACGAGKALADIVGGRAPEVRLRGT